MADDKKTPDEYEYPPEEYYKGEEYIPPENTSEALEPGSPRGAFLSKRVLAIIGILFAIGIVYLVLMFSNARRGADLSQPAPTIDTGAATVPSAASAPQQITQAPVTPQVVGPSVADIQQLAQQNQANQQAMANLQSQLQQLQSQLTQVTTSISTLSNQIQVIANEIKAIETDRSLRGRSLAISRGATQYTLKAIVPGRAWLQARNGTTTTVTVGDRLPGYGIIQMINTNQGIVTTSSGAIIQYGPRDS